MGKIYNASFFSDTQLTKIGELAAESSAERQSLYRSLHNVGDDSIKNDIQDALKNLLPPETYRLVEAVFQLATSDETEE